jgi:hypothetical protein
MQPAGLKAENAFPAAAPAPTGASGSSAAYAVAELRGNPSEHRTAEASNDTSLSRMRLDKLNHSEPVLSAARPQTPQPENTKREVESRENEKDVGEVIASSDEGTASPGKRPLDSKNDKKKMKRFR